MAISAKVKVVYEKNLDNAAKFADEVAKYFSVKVLHDRNKRKVVVNISEVGDVGDYSFICKEYERHPDEEPTPLLEGNGETE